MQAARLASKVVAVAVAGFAGAVLTVPPSHAAGASEPALTVSAAQAAKALTCTDSISAKSRPPILLIHGTTSNPDANWSWNWARALDARGWPHCELALPDSGNADVQIAAEYVVRAIRTMYSKAGERRIDVVGHSQGGMVPRWALKYWPDTRSKVDDLVGLASSNNGTEVFNLQCIASFCTAANWQQRRGSTFLTALNAGPDTWPGISYTQVSTRYDEIVVPSTSTYLPVPTGSRQVVNLAAQDVCPIEVVEHFGMAYSNSAWLIGLDALTHGGPARLGRIPRTTCPRLFMPGVVVSALPGNVVKALSQTVASSLTAPLLPAEPRLQPYVSR